MWIVKEIKNKIILKVFILSVLNARNFVIITSFDFLQPDQVGIIIPFLKAIDLRLRKDKQLAQVYSTLKTKILNSTWHRLIFRFVYLSHCKHLLNYVLSKPLFCFIFPSPLDPSLLLWTIMSKGRELEELILQFTGL